MWPNVALDGDLRDGAPPKYASGEARLQAMVQETLIDGGRRRAGVRGAGFEVTSAAAGYRMAVRDVELDVRLRYAEALRQRREIEVRRQGIQRLGQYLAWLQARRAGGEGVAADVLKTRTRLANEEANTADAERLLDEAQVELNTLMGRDPRAPLAVTPLPSPSPPPSAADAPWLSTPDVAAAAADTGVAAAAIAEARADRLPQLWISLNGGWEPAFQSNPPAPMNNGQGAGVEAVLGFTWPLWNHGLYRAQIQAAQLRAGRARDSLLVVRRQAHLEWARAMEQLEDLYRVYQLRTRSVPIALDSYLEATALYRGGGGTALEVLDAFTSWIDAEIARANAAMNYRQAGARLIRWSGP